MKSKIIIIAAFLVVILAFMHLPWVRNFLAVDKCLDQGGRWNEKSNECESLRY